MTDDRLPFADFAQARDPSDAPQPKPAVVNIEIPSLRSPGYSRADMADLVERYLPKAPQ